MKSCPGTMYKHEKVFKMSYFVINKIKKLK